MPDEKIRLQKFISECGFSSRRKAEEMIAAGRVSVNGRKASIGDKIDPKNDDVKIDGKKLKRPEKQMYIMLNKPRGFITTMSDEMGRKCVASLIADAGASLFPIGRLDRNSEGLLLFTNDGEFANAVMHPRQGIPKTYRVTVSPPASDKQVETLCSGVELDGRLTARAVVRVLEKDEGRGVLEIIIREGRNREIRRMCEIVGLEVKRLKRTAVGSLRLGMLRPGSWRVLTEDEIQHLLTYSEN